MKLKILKQNWYIKIKSKILINKDALPETAYATIDVDKTIKNYPELFDQSSPLNAYISIINILKNGQHSKLKHVASYYIKSSYSDNVSDVKVDENKENALINSVINKVLIFKDCYHLKQPFSKFLKKSFFRLI